MSELYKGMAGSPITYLASDISAGQTTISVADDTALPDAPNICTIGYGEELETIKYGTKSNGVLQNVTRGIEGAPRAWQTGTEVARFFTAYDHDAIAEVLSKNPVWFSEFEEALINSVSTKIFKNLFGNGSKIHASEIITGTQDNYKTVEEFMNIPPLALKRVDALTGRMQITSTNYASPNVVPLSKPYGESMYLICFEIADRRNSPCVMWRGSTSGAAGQIIVGASVSQAVIVGIIRSGDNIGFYSATDATSPVYVTGIYRLD